ncbi:MAG: redoxin domain-containing protein [Candidatus Eremiobacteraeota bacterium]|nr:redoxin domain-containing protein [Candidatus Eremiobacteraeota bacterium]MBV8281418.1 redoxin domain-containing protein [Candidatus Eremiobacteraeota bacterium]
MRGDAPLYHAAGAEVFGINGASVRSHRGFAKLHGFTARLLSDRGLRVARAYDAVTRWGPFTFIDRTVVGIDRTGRIVFYRRGTPRTSDILAGFTGSVTERTAM